jgi:hypothetical protein
VKETWLVGVVLGRGGIGFNGLGSVGKGRGGGNGKGGDFYLFCGCQLAYPFRRARMHSHWCEAAWSWSA